MKKDITLKAIKDEKVVYLTSQDEEKGYDIRLELMGWKIETI